MTDQIDLLLKRAGFGLLRAASLAAEQSGYDSKRSVEVHFLLKILEAYLTDNGHLGINYEKGDDPISAESLSFLVRSDEIAALTQYHTEREAKITQFRKENVNNAHRP